MKKIIMSSLIIFILLSMVCNSFAFDVGVKDLISLGTCEPYLMSAGVNRYTDFVVYRKDGKEYPAYCLDVDFFGVGAEGLGNYSVVAENRIDDIKVWRTIINGYPYKTPSELGVANAEEAFTATKFAVYAAQHNYYYNPVDSDAGRRTHAAFVKIVNDAKNSTETMEDPRISIVTDDTKWKIDDIEKNCLSKTYYANTKVSGGKFKINIEGRIPEGLKIVDLNNNEISEISVKEKFKVVVPVKNLQEDNSFTMKVKAQLETKPILYGKTTIPNTQSYALTGYMYQDTECTYTEKYYKNITKLIIDKREYGTEIKLKGVKFNLLDENRNIVLDNLVTDDEGKIVLEQIVPGKYYIQEIETLDKYNLHTDLIEVYIEPNEEFELLVNNTKKETSRIEKSFEKVEVVSKTSEKYYNIENKIKKLPITGK